jgi:hypothetical protein
MIIEANYPKTIKECTPDQLTKWLILAPVIQDADKSFTRMLDFQVQLVSIFTGLPVNKVRKVHVDDILAASTELLKMLSEYRNTEPSEFIEIEGKRFRFEKDFNHVETGQIIDMKLLEDVSMNPCEALAICYIEEGMTYCQEDARGKVLNPNKKREELFKRAFPGDEFLNFFAFFLRESEKRKLAILGIQIARVMNQNQTMHKKLLETANGLHGQESSSSWRKSLAKMWTLLPASRM